MDCHHDEQSPENSTDIILDDEFRRILWSIKQYIPFINSNYQLALYRSWLEKLSLSSSEKVERNVYLFELARQIKNNSVLPPFNQPPPLGDLKELPKINHFRSSKSQLHTQNSRWPSTEVSFKAPTYPEPNCCCTQNPPQQRVEVERNFSCPTHTSQAKATPFTCYSQPVNNFYYNRCYDDDDDDVDDYIDERLKAVSQRIKKKRPKTGYVPPIHTHNASEKSPEDFGKTSKLEKSPSEESPSRDVPINNEPREVEQENHQELKDDSSWCDLTDASITSLAINSLASGDGEKKEAIAQQTVQLRFNEFRRAIEQSARLGTEDLDCIQNKKPSSGDSECDSLKKIQILGEAKFSLKDTNFISEDWKKTIESLQIRLTETLHQNNDLKAIIDAMQVQMEEEVVKCKDQTQKKLTEQHNKEVEALKQIQTENVKHLEKSFQVKLDEAEINYLQKVDKIKITYEAKIKELRTERDHAKKEKDKEIARLTEIVQQQCTRMSNEIAALRQQIETSMSNSNEEKIVVLQKCVSKMDKLFQRTEKEYQKQLEKLKQELELKDKVMQIQLKTQRAELIARTSSEKQRHFDDVVNNLEVKYIKMLEYHEAQVTECRKQDEEKIERLLSLLEKNNIPYD